MEPWSPNMKGVAASSDSLSSLVSPPSRLRAEEIEEDFDDDPARFCQFHIGERKVSNDETTSRDARESSAESQITIESFDSSGTTANLASQSSVSSFNSNYSGWNENATTTSPVKGKAFRPKTLSIPSLGKLITVKQLHQQPGFDTVSGSLPSSGGVLPHKKHHHHFRPSSNHHHSESVPKIKCNHVSAPTTPSGTSLGWHEHDLHHHSSISSIDEAQEAAFLSPDDTISIGSVDTAVLHGPAAGKKRSKSRLSLNLISNREDRSPSPGRSPSLIPKFLRNSFSKLLSRKTSDETVTPGHPASDPSNAVSSLVVQASTPFPKSASAAVLKKIGNEDVDDGNELSTSSPEVSGYIPGSPTTQEHIEQSKLSGLPVIPFAFPTSVVAERLKNKKNLLMNGGKAPRQKTPSGDSNKSEPKDIVKPRQKVDAPYEFDLDDDGPKSLENLVHIAQKELMKETLFDIYSTDDQVLCSSSAAVSEKGSSWRGSSDLNEPSAGGSRYGDEEEEEILGCWTPEPVERKRSPQLLPSPLSRKRESSEDDGYMEMNCKASNTNASPPTLSRKERHELMLDEMLLRHLPSKCLVEAERTRPPGEEVHFEMDFTTKQ